jgi:hypothetical protein
MKTTNDRFDLEQQILDCWHLTDDLGLLFEYVMESEELDRDKLSNIILGMKELYQLKFDRCFNTFETLVEQKKII